MRSYIYRALSLAAVLALAGCFGAMDKYGATIQKMYRDQLTIDVVLPRNASSISQHYRRFKLANAHATPGADDGLRKEHLGIDIIGVKGTTIIAPASGRVVKSFVDPAFGNTIEIAHGTDYAGRNIHSVYKHLSSKSVKVGDTVIRGQKLGGLGNTGFLSSGILHLHFEILRQNNRGVLEAVDPSHYWLGGVGKVVCFDAAADWPDQPFRISYPVVCR